MSTAQMVRINETNLAVKTYKGKRVVTLKEIDEVHERPEGTARKRFNDNKERFIEGEDYFVRKTDEAKKEYNLIAPNGLVLLTESGYLMLVKSFTDDLAWNVQRELVNSYFRTARPAVDQTVPLMRVRLQAATLISKLWNAAGIKPEYQAMALQDKFPDLIPKLPAIALQQTKVTYDKGTIAKRLGMYSRSDNPHAQAVGAIIRQLDVSAEEQVQVPYCNNGHDGFDTQYTESVITKARRWLKSHNWPTPICLEDKMFAVNYLESQEEI